ncbi:MAG: sigma-70 family RNA polymerase sigma factor [Candidatus Thiodiazotropha sp. 6PLUC2]
MSSSEQSDEALFRHFRNGDNGAFEVLYQRYRQTVYLFLLRSCSERGDAEEIYQDVWSRIITATKPFQEGAFKAYIFRIARNLLIDRHRRNHLTLVKDDQALAEVANPGKTLEDKIVDEDCSDRLKQHLTDLPAEQREVFLLKEEVGLSLVQIASMIDVGRETVKSRLRYALKQLRNLLEECL